MLQFFPGYVAGILTVPAVAFVLYAAWPRSSALPAEDPWFAPPAGGGDPTGLHYHAVSLSAEPPASAALASHAR